MYINMALNPHFSPGFGILFVKFHDTHLFGVERDVILFYF